jgi:hypothetical protein
MPLTSEQFLKRLSSLTDPAYLCEVLGITPEDIIRSFDDLIEEKIDVLREAFDVDLYIGEGEED